MKKLLLLSLTILSFSLHAENWLNDTKILNSSIEAYSLKADCERISGEKCYDLGEYPSFVYSRSTIQVDDYEKPIIGENDEVIGYEKKSENTIILDQEKLATWESQEAIKASARLREVAIQKALTRIECGKRIIAVLVYRNSLKDLTTGQIGQVNTSYASIVGLINTGSITTAKQAMMAATPDGTIITAQDKTELIAEAEKCEVE